MRRNSSLTLRATTAAHPRRRLLLGVLISATVAGAPTVARPGTAMAGAGLPRWPDHPNWQRLVPAPPGDQVTPVRVVRTAGSVTNPQALTGQRHGSTVLTVAPGGPAASVVLDFGHEVGGEPDVNVSGSGPGADTPALP